MHALLVVMRLKDNSSGNRTIAAALLLFSIAVLLLLSTTNIVPIINPQQYDAASLSHSDGSGTEMEKRDNKRNVIFIHPDGTTQSHFSSVRFLEVGPDGLINWDMLPEVAIYKGHMKDALTSTSQGGATTHGSGVKVLANSYGCDGNCTEQTLKRTVVEEARDEGYDIGIINSGSITEPGTGAFVAHVTERNDGCEIVRQIVEESGATLILGGGEKYYLSTNDTSFHPNPMNELMPDKGRCQENMIEVARNLGYTVVFNESQLADLKMTQVEKVLGIFAYDDTYNALSERKLFDLGDNVGISQVGECDDVCRLYEPYAPTFDEMVKFAIDFLDLHSDRGFVLVAEEEGTDNFGNDNMNAEGMIEAARRADRAIGHALEFVKHNLNNTLVMTAADSDAGVAAIIGPQQKGNYESLALDDNGCFTEPDFPGLDPLELPPDQEPVVDGVTDFSILKQEMTTNGTGIFCEKPFVAQPDQFGNQLLFGIRWLPGGGPDVGGGTITRAYGCNAEDVKSTLDNTELPRIMAECLELQDPPPFEP
ncbi:MAG: alkaline phosphatase [Thermoproteota archaeon]|nr:alkaline phosphatase [Thermoproteota archaeon]